MQPDAPASGRATAAMVLGIVSIVLCLGFLSGIPAAILGKLELTAIDEGRAPEAGRTRATVGMVMGLLATVASCLGCGIYITAISLELAK
jgi:hypothetical protein